MPWASTKIAYSLPMPVTEMISRQTLELLDKLVLEDSALPPSRQQSIREHFEDALLPRQRGEFAYRLHFRSMQEVPNAFALPAGDIIVTDRLVELAASQQEIDAVLLHEIGHVEHRHGLRQLLHSSFITIAIIMISGDVTAVNNLAIALPAFLLENHYSRQHESDADRFAFDHMMQAGIDPIHFSRIMARISEQAMEQPGDGKTATVENPSDGKARDKESLLMYLSTHPPTPERMKQAEQYSASFRARHAGEP
jgi:Zn-dependent protease with chaperone function